MRTPVVKDECLKLKENLRHTAVFLIKLQGSHIPAMWQKLVMAVHVVNNNK